MDDQLWVDGSEHRIGDVVGVVDCRVLEQCSDVSTTRHVYGRAVPQRVYGRQRGEEQVAAVGRQFEQLLAKRDQPLGRRRPRAERSRPADKGLLQTALGFVDQGMQDAGAVPEARKSVPLPAPARWLGNHL